MASVPRPLVRRLISIPGLTTAFVLGVVAGVVVVPVLGIIDQLRGDRRFRLARVWMLALGVAFTELFAAAWCGLLWLRFALGRRIRSEPSMAAHTRAQRWWVRSHLRNLRWSGGLHLVIDEPDSTRIGNAIVVARHASHADAVLPAFLYGELGDRRLRYTLKDDLQWLPALDLAANRLPNVFVDRSPGPDSPLIGWLELLAGGVDDDSVGVIFPEGTFYTPERLDRAAERLAATRPDLEATARTLRYMLPPRPAGTLALFRGAPDADIILVGHVGIENFGSLAEIAKKVPLQAPMRVRMWRFDRSDVPTDEKEQTTWLLERWVEVDEWIADQVERRAEGDSFAPDENGVVPDEIVA